MKIAVIPARGGSKRIPRKNIREFAGKPMIAHSIECAIQTGLFDTVIVSTDDPEISEIAKEFGAEVPFIRPKEISDDYTGTHEVVGHAVRWMLDNDYRPSEVCCIYATAPFIRQEDILEGHQMLTTDKWKMVFAATSYNYPIFRSFKKRSDGGLEMVFPEHSNSRSQDLPEVFHDAGQFYWGRAETWLEEPTGFDATKTVVIIPRWLVQDIDTLEDWKYAELLWKVLKRGEGEE